MDIYEDEKGVLPPSVISSHDLVQDQKNTAGKQTFQLSYLISWKTSSFQFCHIFDIWIKVFLLPDTKPGLIDFSFIKEHKPVSGMHTLVNVPQKKICNVVEPGYSSSEC